MENKKIVTDFEKVIEVADVLDSVFDSVPDNAHLKEKCIWLSVQMHFCFFVHKNPGHAQALWHLT